MPDKAKRGVVYFVWGREIWGQDTGHFLKRSIQSLHRFHPDMPVQVFRLPPEATLLEKAVVFRATPFEETLFLDIDTIVLDRLDFGFEQARRFGLACCINESPWARRYGGLSGDMVEYNTGVLFFSRQAEAVFTRWEQCVRNTDSSMQFWRDGELKVMPLNDQAGFARAVAETGFNPFVLPLNWNYRTPFHQEFFGPLKIWHSYTEVPEKIKAFNEEQCRQESVIRFSAGDRFTVVRL
ncbi:MAG TPA: hypothetical protein VN611_07535 [Patescibacteria group bacterium]|nr:hypothetical protein [Patescibacteria group bacterium]